MPVWLPTSYSGNNGTSHFSYQLETGELPFGVHITPSERHRETANELPNGKKILMITAHFMAQCF